MRSSKHPMFGFKYEVRHSWSRFEFEMRHSPNISFQADRNPRERGSRPLNSSR